MMILDRRVGDSGDTDPADVIRCVEATCGSASDGLKSRGTCGSIPLEPDRQRYRAPDIDQHAYCDQVVYPRAAKRVKPEQPSEPSIARKGRIARPEDEPGESKEEA